MRLKIEKDNDDTLGYSYKFDFIGLDPKENGGLAIMSFPLFTITKSRYVTRILVRDVDKHFRMAGCPRKHLIRYYKSMGRYNMREEAEANERV